MIMDERETEQPDEPVPADPFSVMCPFCHALAGSQCVNTITKVPLRRFAWHPVRLKAASA